MTTDVPRDLLEFPSPIIGMGFAQNSTIINVSTSEIIPFDNTKPQSTEGQEIETLAYTPKSANSRIMIEYGTWIEPVSNNPRLTLALFKDAEADAISATSVHPHNSGREVAPKDICDIPSPGTSEITFKVRAGTESSSSGWRTNSTDGTNALFNGLTKTFIKITEYIP